MEEQGNVGEKKGAHCLRLLQRAPLGRMPLGTNRRSVVKNKKISSKEKRDNKTRLFNYEKNP